MDSEIGKVRPGKVVPVMYPGGVHALLDVTWLVSRSYTTIHTFCKTQEDIRNNNEIPHPPVKSSKTRSSDGSSYNVNNPTNSNHPPLSQDISRVRIYNDY